MPLHLTIEKVSRNRLRLDQNVGAGWLDRWN